MAVEGIDIDMAQVVAISTNIKGINQELKTIFDELDQEIKNTKNNWDSNAQDELYTQYKKFSLQKESFHKDLDSYAAYLKNVADEYGYTESVVKNNAESFM